MKLKLFLGIILLLGVKCFSQNTQVPFETLLDMASKDNALAQYQMGLCYLNGQGTVKNYFMATHWFSYAYRNKNQNIISDLKTPSFKALYPGFHEFLLGLVESHYKNNKHLASRYYWEAYNLSGLRECQMFHYMYNPAPNLTPEQKDSINRLMQTTEPMCQAIFGEQMLRNRTHNDTIQGLILITESIDKNFPYGHNVMGFFYSYDKHPYYNESLSAYHLLQAEKYKHLEYHSSRLLSYYYEAGKGGLEKDIKRVESLEKNYIEPQKVMEDFLIFLDSNELLK